VRSNSLNVSFKLKEGHIVGEEKAPKETMKLINNYREDKGIFPEERGPAKDVTVLFVN